MDKNLFSKEKLGARYRKFIRYWMIVKIFIIRDPYRRAKYLKRKHYFHAQGDHCYFQITNFNTEPHLISFGNNVHIARGVEFFTHDVISHMFNYMYNDAHFVGRVGRVDIGDNVFIGGCTTILYNVKIGNNVIIAANSLIIKDIPDGVVVGGQPVRVIGSFDEYVYKMKEYSQKMKQTYNSFGNIPERKKQERVFWSEENINEYFLKQKKGQ